jgi:pyridoxamine 5'-phosphate oxidase family protein
MTQHAGQSTTASARRTTLTEWEVAYLSSQRLGRIATVDPRGRPRLVETGFNVHPTRGTIELGGFDLSSTQRVKDIRSNPYVSLIVDDVDLSSGTWDARGVEIRGTAVFHPVGTPSTLARSVSRGGWMELTPDYVRSWGLE